jgi:hypothetical protein
VPADEQGFAVSDAWPGLVVTATITGTGVLTVWGLDPSPRVLDEGAPPAARNALVNLLHDHAVSTAQAICAATRTPAGPWYYAVTHTGATCSVDPDLYTDVALPELDPQEVLAGTAAVFAAAAGSPPAAILALASDPDPAIRAEALAELATWADDPTPVADAELPAERLARLAGCGLSWVRVGVAANPGTSHSTQVDLVAGGDPAVLAALAARFDLAPELIVMLASVPDATVRAELRRNPAAGFLIEASPSRVAVAATPTPEGPPDLAAASAAPAEDPSAPSARVPASAALTVLDPAATTGPAPGSRPGRGRAVAVAAAGVLLLGGFGAAAVSTLADDPAAASATTPSQVALWNGMALPAGPHGPTDPAGDIATGFGHSELGAAMAAAHLSVRIDPYAGPASFTPTITGQTYGGDPAALLDATRARYDQIAAAAGITDGGPIPTSTGQITGWSTEDWTPAAPSTVHLRVVGVDGIATDYGITVVWADGDYRLLDPTRADTFTTRPADDPSSYRSF